MGLRHAFLVLSVLLPSGLATPADAEDVTMLAHAPEEASAHPPLIVLMHGSGADERDMIGLWHDLPPDFVVVAPRAPFRGGGGYVWYRKTGASPRPDDLATSRKIVSLVLDAAVARFHADPKRVFIGGFSQGAVMTYEIALREPSRFRGAVVLSGSLFSSAVAEATTGHLPAFFIGHGTADPRVPFAAATGAQAKLTALGASVAFHAYEGMGHGTGTAEARDLAAWLAARTAR